MRLEALDLERLLILEEQVVHLPVFSLVPGTMRCLGCFARLWMDLVEGKVSENVADLSCLNILRLESRQGGLEESLAERALVIREFDHRDRGGFFSPGKIPGNA